jgi:hypothetical protein
MSRCNINLSQFFYILEYNFSKIRAKFHLLFSFLSSKHRAAGSDKAQWYMQQVRTRRACLVPSISGPKKILKPGQTVNLKVKVAIFYQNTYINTLRGWPEARAAARAVGTLGPPLVPSHSLSSQTLAATSYLACVWFLPHL